MSEDINTVNMLLRREIEALVTVPMLKAFIEEFGKEKTFDIARSVVKSLAKDAGKMMAEFVGGNQLSDLEKAMPAFSENSAVEFEIIENTRDKIELKVTRCKYAEMYKSHNMEEFGYLLSCGRDASLFEGFNSDITFVRNQTIMEGAEYCDFCWENS